ncbi:MAG: NAD(P)/FAD-dependent oxidoreductase [Actinomycetota bacterium]|nr:NAD(P)/FAD-dependent oxidoreductase [Actinomycetota bacterium]
MYMLHKSRELGFRARVFEAGSGVGGTWYWNRYPGARCDIESLEYSFGFDEDLQQEWDWSERYATQPEILDYAEHVADRFDLHRDMTFNTRVASARWDEASSTWTVETARVDGSGGERFTCRYVVMATGCLSSANLPDIPGRDDFAGSTYHTGHWPHDGVDFTGKRVGIIGTGSSALQAIPIIAEQADHLTVFQRTATYAVPAWNRPLSPDEVAEVKAHYAELRKANRTTAVGYGGWRQPPERGVLEVSDEEREAILERAWNDGGLAFLGAFTDVLIDPRGNEIVAEWVRRRIRRVVQDPKVAELLCPTQVIGCKRLCVDTGYYETFNRDNVLLIDLNATPIERIEATGIRTTAELHEFDELIFATGFDAMTGALLKVDITGRDGLTLQEAWSAGPRTYLGLGSVNFPNLFMITGPGSPSVLTNMLTSIQQHVEWIGDCLVHLRDNGLTTVEAEPQAQDNWVDYVNLVAGFTLFPTCNSWYLGANVPGKTRVFMPLPGFGPYAEFCDSVAANGYQGFALS